MPEIFKEYALIVAGGSGSRIKSEVPKQFLEIGALPVLMHTCAAFYRYTESINIILVLPPDQISFWESLCVKYDFLIPHIVVEGGSTRQQSVKNGLNKIDDEGFVAIHDGVRPFVSVNLIKSGFATARKYGNAVAAISLKDSLRYIASKKNISVNRADYRLVQTPQTFSNSIIRKAYELCKEDFTDDASVAENAGHDITLIEGNYSNFKITTSEDLIYAEAMIRRSEL
ncbi:MAG: 2-C-methyl-D-erythritol 4-phosphate cytidylyltransferase [Bacteroidota bacterium]|nr:2-C-methyl-D-erythritol 4-phosphate cytidylyltransferase [Bacteroidota bacterium]